MEFQVIFESLEAKTPEEKELIKQKLIEKFKVPVDKAERMIKSAPIVVKKGLNEEQAKKYRSALESIGAIATLRPIEDQKIESQKLEQPAVPVSEPVEPPAPVVVPEPPVPIKSAPIEEAQKTEVAAKSEQDFLIFQHDFDKKPPLPPPALFEPLDPLKTQISSAPADPFKTQIGSRSTAEQKLDPPSTAPIEKTKTNTDESEMPTQHQPAITAPSASAGEWWEKAIILNPPYDESVASITPITSGRVSTQPNGFSVSHPMIERIRFEEILFLAVFQTGLNTTARLFIDIFISSMKRPVRLNADLIDYNTFALPENKDAREQLADFIKLVLGMNRNIVIDLATYKFLKERERIKIVRMDRDVEKYCGKLQSEIEKGLDEQSNKNIISGRDAINLIDEDDPWAAQPSPSQPPGPQPPVTGAPPFPPNVYTTQPMRPMGTAPPPVNPGQPAPPFQPQPQQYQPPMPPPGYSPGYAPPPMGAPQVQPYGMPKPEPPPQRPPDFYPGQGQYGNQMPGQFPQPGQMPMQMPGQFPGMPPGFGYANPAMEFEINKAKEGAKTALILSIIGVLPCGCLFPLSILGLIKAQDALRIMDTYGLTDDRNKAFAAKIIAIVGLVINALVIMTRFIR
jgi:hypothetical protein